MIVAAKERSVPMRSCLGCGSKFAKGVVLRFVAQNGVLVVDLAQSLPGRGAYCCHQVSCLKKCLAKKGRLARALRQVALDCQSVTVLLASTVADHQSGIDKVVGMDV